MKNGIVIGDWLLINEDKVFILFFCLYPSGRYVYDSKYVFTILVIFSKMAVILTQSIRMKPIFFLFAILLFVLITTPILAQIADTTTQITQSVQADSLHTATNDPGYVEDDFAPGIFGAIILLIVFILVCIGAGIVLTIVGLVAAFALVSFGILSTSILVGLHQKSFAKGFKTLLVITSTLGGLVCGGVGLGILNTFLYWWDIGTSVFIGSICGMLAGFAFGILAYYIIQRFVMFFKQKFNLSTALIEEHKL
ncbi:hypothetical protein [Xanthocytophaga flava]|uniref:hypothetical protein n=1 Tax=Xanthocytophaga flava TaxID=3048013 RepID=UPI0028D8CA74|nr:hypothetical protein [Xanthocytophaga flavus]MDJ1470549.1 hypothetical protein [Xanthocytophaga flavus]